MSKEIDQLIKMEEAILGVKTTKSTDLLQILKKVNNTKGGMIINLPWNGELHGEYKEYIQVIAVKVTKENLYFLNPIKSRKIKHSFAQEYGIENSEPDGTDRISIKDLVAIHKRNHIIGIIES